MVFGANNLLTSSQGAQLFAIQQTSRDIGEAQLRLASGRRVNSALDNPQNFFTSFSLTSEASDLNRVLDRLSQVVRTIQSSQNSTQFLQNTITEASGIVQEGQQAITDGRGNVGDIILADDPVIFYRLDETSGNVATNLGTAGAVLNGRFDAGVTLDSGELHLGVNNSSVRFDGINDRIRIPNNALVNTSAAGYPERTVELTFQADNLDGRQVLFEEGGTGNAAGIYLDNDRIYFVARDAGDFGPFNISAEVEAGRTYQAAFVLDSNAGTFTGFLNGEEVGVGAVNRPLSRHGGAVAIGRNAGGTFFHDGANGGNGEYFEGRISDFALYNSVLTQENLQERFAATQLGTADEITEQVNEVFSSINPLIEDSSFQGINLLQGDDLTAFFSVDGSSNLDIQGEDFNLTGLGLSNTGFSTFNELDSLISNIEGASNQLENFTRGLVSDLSIIETRRSFTEETINTLEAGSDDLVNADQQAESARLLTLQTRQEIQFTTLALSSQQTNIGDLLGAPNPLLGEG